MRNIQEIFNAVIDAGFFKLRVNDTPMMVTYNFKDWEDWRTYANFDEFMCNSLFIACHRGTITEDEREFAQEEIDSYLGDISTALQTALDYSKLDSDFESRQKIYQDWGNRPKLEHRRALWSC